jgi:hypothetical protein
MLMTAERRETGLKVSRVLVVVSVLTLFISAAVYTAIRYQAPLLPDKVHSYRVGRSPVHYVTETQNLVVTCTLYAWYVSLPTFWVTLTILIFHRARPISAKTGGPQ